MPRPRPPARRVSIALELLFLAGLAACAACKAIHPFRSTLWSAGAVAAALGIRGANDSYNFLWLTALADVSVGAAVQSGGKGPSAAGELLFAPLGRHLAAHGALLRWVGACAGRRGRCPTPAPPAIALRPQSKAYNGQLVYMIGAAIWVAGNLLLAFTGDAM